MWDNLQTKSMAMPVTKANAGLRAYMLRVYNYMAAGLVISGLMAFLGAQPPVASYLYTQTQNGATTLSGLGWIILFAPFIMIFMINSAARQLNAAKAQVLFWIFSALMGLSLSSIFLAYTAHSLLTTFLVTAGAFGGLSLYGYTTSRDLTPMRAFLSMGLIGLIIAMIVNFFVGGTALSLGISVIGVVIFAGLTAADTQQIRQTYQMAQSSKAEGSFAIMGALQLYLDFINLFLFLLRFMGNNRN